MLQTGEDLQGLRKIIDFTRYISLFILAVHCYLCCYAAFKGWQLSSAITDRLLNQVAQLPLFANIWLPKLAALVLLTISLIGAKGKKEEKFDKASIVALLTKGLLLYWLSLLLLYLPIAPPVITFSYMALTASGYLLILTGGNRLSRLLKASLDKDIFNELNETFPQEERKLENEYSINLPTKYRLREQVKDGWINIINPFRGLLVAGTPGAGKSYFVIRHLIDQHIRKGFSMFIYDFKFDDLTKIAYNKLRLYRGNYSVIPAFYMINFDDLSRTHRCNPLDPGSMTDITDAAEASRTIMLGLNREWIKKQGDFFVESAVNFLTAVIWYLRKWEDGKYCTLPHVIELMQTDYDSLFTVMMEEEEVRVLINPFVSALLRKAMPQLEGQIASAKIGLARLASPSLYYVLSGNDFTLDINNPAAPKIVCLGNNPQKLQVYGAVLSLFTGRMLKLVNQKGKLKSSLVFDEFPTIFLNNIDSLIATARSNKVATTLAVQDFSQLKKDYGAEQAEVITGIVGNVIAGQVTGETAKKLSENFGKIMQERHSMNLTSEDTSMSRSLQLDYAIPAAKIAGLSSGEFVGFVADDPQQRIPLKMFHSSIQNDHEALASEEAGWKPVPQVANVSVDEVYENYLNIKQEVRTMVSREMERLEALKPKVQVSGNADQQQAGKEPVQGVPMPDDPQQGLSQ